MAEAKTRSKGWPSQFCVLVITADTGEVGVGGGVVGGTVGGMAGGSVGAGGITGGSTGDGVVESTFIFLNV